MALIKCPECGQSISEFANNCPNCGFPTLTTRFRIKINLKGGQDVFGVNVLFLYENQKRGSVRLLLDDFGGSYEFKYIGICDLIEIAFEEHLVVRRFKFDLRDGCGKKYGIEFFEQKNINDSPTYAGAFSYNHPCFSYEVCNYGDINAAEKVELRYN